MRNLHTTHGHIMNEKTLKKIDDGLVKVNDNQLVQILQESQQQTQLLFKQVRSQNNYNKIIFFFMMVMILIIIFGGIKFFEKIPDGKPDDSGISLQDVISVSENLVEKYRKEIKDLENSIAQNSEKMTLQKEQDQKQVLSEIKKHYESIISSMEKSRDSSEKLSLQYKKQVNEYETTISLQKKRIDSITGEVAKIQSQHFQLQKKYQLL